MTEIERKALELVNDVSEVQGVWFSRDVGPLHETLCRAIEQHESFRQEVSDAVLEFYGGYFNALGEPLERFILPPKPDPLVDAVKDILNEDSLHNAEEFSEAIRAALAKRGLEIREKSDG